MEWESLWLSSKTVAAMAAWNLVRKEFFGNFKKLLTKIGLNVLIRHISIQF